MDEGDDGYDSGMWDTEVSFKMEVEVMELEEQLRQTFEEEGCSDSWHVLAHLLTVMILNHSLQQILTQKVRSYLIVSPC